MRQRSLLFIGSGLLAISLVLSAFVVNGQVAPWWLFGPLCVGVLGAAVAMTRSSCQVAAEPLNTMIEQLAEAVHAQWGYETSSWRVHDSFPLSVTWAAPELQVADRWIGVTSSDVRGELPVAGREDDLGDLFSRIPSRRLVLIGPPGSGKTVAAALLALDLLQRRRPGDPVPVLMPMRSWDPSARSYHGWLVDQLVAQFPALARVIGPGSRPAAEMLVRSGLLVPVLDGFDELPARFRATAILQLNSSLTAADALVLTSRDQEYAEALVRSTVVLVRAAVVELRPLPAATVVEYLRASMVDVDASERVARLFTKVNLDQPLWRILGSPSMVHLFRSAYSVPFADPAELLDRSRFPDADSIERHLLRSFVNQALRRSASPFGFLTPVRADPAQADKWLSFIAAHLASLGQQDLAWWELDQALPAWASIGAGALLVGAGAGAAVMIRHGPGPAVIAATISAAVASIIGVVIARRSREAPRVASFPRRRPGLIMRALFIGFAAAAPLALISAQVTGWMLGAAVGVVLWAGIGVTAWLADTTPEQYLAGPAATLRASRLFAAATWIVIGLSAAVVWSLVAQRLIIDGTTVSLVAAAATLIWLIPGSAWGRFTVARTWLAARGMLPWRLFSFLEAMYHAGLLRQTGPTYQFRNAYLRDVLADDSTHGQAKLDRDGVER